ncbi:olfactory receptor 5F1-like [Erpetoichthys calabaricus]|uniref:olfactory receptor 5F1-like n=1 Tax=Erpetoichthys calabaricus TaxID=27687 RepID=UPI00109FC360|nr:olfactory receptor 5F1-like [Erpetoichthys calabaricus]
MNTTTIPESDFVLNCMVATDKKTFTVATLALIYLITLFGNLLVILVILINHQLQTPMFFCIGALAAIDLANSSNLIPKMLSLLIFDYTVVSSGFCLLQMVLVFHLEVIETLLLGLMAYDRYVAVVYPLRYPSIITNRTVFIFLLVFNGIGLIDITPFIIYAKELPFCKTNVLPYCFCDYSTMVHIACTEDPKYLTILSITAAVLGIGPLVLILFSYTRIAYAALKISSVEGKRKVFSTCLTHLLVVGLFYCPLLLSYVLPGAGVKLSTEAYNTMVIVGNIIPPMLNPLIYSFRNKEIKNSIYKLFMGKRTVTQIEAKK